MFTDFGLEGPYMGQMQAVLCREASDVPVITLFADAPSFNICASAYLLAAYANEFPADTVFLCVVDPGVGSSRRPVMVQADGRWYIGPDNGLFEIVRRRSLISETYEITWQPEGMSASFHGRDLFAPVAAMLATGKKPDSRLVEPDVGYADWPDDLAEIIYIDHFGNAMTGLRGEALTCDTVLEVSGRKLLYSRTFSDAGQGECFWYENANGLIEIAANQSSAAEMLHLSVGTALRGASESI